MIRVKKTFLIFNAELTCHMMKEEMILFPMIRQLDTGADASQFHCSSVSQIIRQMEHEHDLAGGALAEFRKLTDAYVPPAWACNTYRAMLDALARLELDMHRHVHKENNILFPKAIEQETSHAGKAYLS